MTAVRGWKLTVDWSGGGGLTGPLEDVTNYIDRGPVKVGWGRPTDGIQLDTPTGELEFSLRNRDRSWDRYFSPENASSPIYGKITPGKAVTLTKTVRGAAVVGSETWSAAGTAGWVAVGGGTVSRVASPSDDGNGSLQYVPPGAVATVGVVAGTTRSIANEPTGKVTVTFRVRCSSAYTDVRAAVDWYDVAGAFISSSAGSALSVAATTWTTITSDAFTPPALAVGFRPRLQIGSTPANTLTFNVDSAESTSTPNDAGKTYTLHQGVLDDISVDSLGAARTFSGKSMDAWGRPSSQSLSTPVYSGIRTGTAIGLVLDAIGWTGPRDIDPGATLISYWWEEGTDPADAIKSLVCSEGPPAIAYVDAGVFVFRDRHHRVRQAASTTSQALFSHITPAGSGPGVDYKTEKGTFVFDYGLRDIVNSVTFEVPLRRPGVIQEVWSQDDPVAMNAGEVTTIFAQPGDPVINAITPTQDNSGIQVVSGSFTATIDRTSGQKFIITVTCTGTGIMSRIALRGSPLPVARTVQVRATDAASIARFGRAEWPEEAPWCNQYDAQALADRILAIYADNRPRVTFTIVAINDRYTSAMLTLKVGHRITVRNDVLGINGEFHVERLDHEVDRLTIHRLTVSCIKAEPLQPSNALTFGVAGKGFDQGQFAITGIDNASSMFIFDQAGQGFDQGLFAT